METSTTSETNQHNNQKKARIKPTTEEEGTAEETSEDRKTHELEHKIPTENNPIQPIFPKHMVGTYTGILEWKHEWTSMEADKDKAIQEINEYVIPNTRKKPTHLKIKRSRSKSET